MRVVLADDHALFRAGIRRLLEDLHGVEVLAEADNGLAVPALVELHAPDAVILDLSMPGLNGIELSRRLAAEFPRLGILIITMHTDVNYVRSALEAGAHGFMVKDCAPAELGQALASVAEGRRYVAPALAADLLDNGGKSGGSASAAPRLTRRQQQVLDLIGEGLSTRQIAGELAISAKTVETHRARIMERLGIRSGRQLLRYAIRAGGSGAGS